MVIKKDSDKLIRVGVCERERDVSLRGRKALKLLVNSDQCDQILQNLGTLVKSYKMSLVFFEGLFTTGHNFEPILANLYTTGQIFIFTNVLQSEY